MKRIRSALGGFRRVIYVLLFLVVVLVMLNIGSYMLDVRYRSDDVSSRVSVVEVGETNVVPQVYSCGVETVVVTPVASVSDPLSIRPDSSSLPSLLPNIMPAFAIPSDQMTVTLTEWACMDANGYPYGIVVDSSNNVYFAETFGNKIGRLNSSTNVITEWTIPTANSYPYGIVVDSSNNVYFTEGGGNKIGRLS